MTDRLSAQFSKGVGELNMTVDEIQTWTYCGGNQNRHYNYFKLRFPNEELPDYQSHCLCNHKITENCYITKNEEIIILGNCCIKRFISKSGRTCIECLNPHKNRKHNICNDCLVDRCFECLTPCSGYKFCSRHYQR